MKGMKSQNSVISFYLKIHLLIVITHILQVTLIKLSKNNIYYLDSFNKKFFKLKNNPYWWMENIKITRTFTYEGLQIVWIC